MVSCHNRLQDAFFESCRRAGIGGQMEVGSGLGHDAQRTRPAVLVPIIGCWVNLQPLT